MGGYVNLCEDLKNEIRRKRFEEGAKISELMEMAYVSTPAMINRIITPINDNGQSVCECCGKLFDNRMASKARTTCSNECSNTMRNFYYRLKKWFINDGRTATRPPHPKNCGLVKDQALDENNYDLAKCVGYIKIGEDEYGNGILEPVFEESVTTKRIRKIVTAALKEHTSYGKMVAKIDHDKADKKGMTYANYIESRHKQFCNTQRREFID